jgi:hypothetical protein
MKAHNIKTLISSIILEAVISFRDDSTTKAHTQRNLPENVHLTFTSDSIYSAEVSTNSFSSFSISIADCHF